MFDFQIKITNITRRTHELTVGQLYDLLHSFSIIWNARLCANIWISDKRFLHKIERSQVVGLSQLRRYL